MYASSRLEQALNNSIKRVRSTEFLMMSVPNTSNRLASDECGGRGISATLIARERRVLNVCVVREAFHVDGLRAVLGTPHSKPAGPDLNRSRARKERLVSCRASTTDEKVSKHACEMIEGEIPTASRGTTGGFESFMYTTITIEIVSRSRELDKTRLEKIVVNKELSRPCR
jgi:hypothetical protein